MKMLKIILSLFCTLALGLEQGTLSTESPFPLASVVLIEVGDGNFCTAYQVQPRHLALAAHCVTERSRNLEKAGNNVRVKPAFTTGSILRWDRRPVVPLPQGCTEEAEIENTYVHPSFHYSGYEYPRALPHLTSDVALIVLGQELADIPVGKLELGPLPPGVRIAKTGYGCESSLKEDIDRCTSGKDPFRRLKFQFTRLLDGAMAMAKLPEFVASSLSPKLAPLAKTLRAAVPDYYLFSEALFSDHPPKTAEEAGPEGRASLSYFDSGGPLLAVDPQGRSSLIGVNSRGPLWPGVAFREAVAFDLHTRLQDTGVGSVGHWLKVLLGIPAAQPQSTAFYFDIINEETLVETPGGLFAAGDFRFKPARPQFQKIRSYFFKQTALAAALVARLEGKQCPWTLNAVELRPRKDGDPSLFVVDGEGKFSVPQPQEWEAVRAHLKAREIPGEKGLCFLSLFPG